MKNLFFFLLAFMSIQSSNAGSYRTNGNGNFSNPAIWEVLTVIWVPAANAPTSGTHNITISAGDTVTLDVDIQLSDNISNNSPDVNVLGKLIFSNNHYIEGEDDISAALPGLSQFRLYDLGEIQNQNGGSLLTSTHNSSACLRGFANYFFEPLCNITLIGGSTYSLPSELDSVGNLFIDGAGVISTSQNLVINGTLNTQGKFHFNHRLTINGSSIIDAGIITNGSNAELHYRSAITPQFIPEDITSLKQLKVDISNPSPWGAVYFNENLSITSANGLILSHGHLNSNNDSLFLLNDAPVSGSTNSLVNATVVIDVATASSASYEYISFPVGTAYHGYQPLRINLSTDGGVLNKTRIAVSAPSIYAPYGTPNFTTLSGVLANRYWHIKVIPTSTIVVSNFLHSVANIEVQVSSTNQVPVILSSGTLAFSTNNAVNSYSGLTTSVSLPYLTSLPLTTAQRNDLGSADGSYIGITNNNSIAAGNYCIGPSASYVPPAGQGTYINATNPYNNMTEAIEDLNLKSAWGHVNFVLQNNYSGATEASPMIFKYIGSATRKANFILRSDSGTPRLIAQNRADDGKGIFHFEGASYVTFDGSMGNISCSSTKGIELRNSGIGAKTISFNSSNNITIKGLEIKANQNGTAIHFLDLGSSNQNIQIECNLFEPYDMNLNSHYAILANGGNAQIHINDNQFNGYLNPFYLSNAYGGLWEIEGNSFYRNFIGTTDRFFIISPSPIYTATFNIHNNYFGGTAPYCGGSKLNIAGIKPCVLQSGYTTSISNFSNNHFRNLNNNTSTTDSIDLLEVRSGGWDIDGNTFGNPAVANDISSTTSYKLNILDVDVPIGDTRPVNITNNSVNNIDFSATASSSNGSFYGIKADCPSANLNISNNTLSNIKHGAGNEFYLIKASSSSTSIKQFKNNIAKNIHQTSNFSGNKGFHITGNNWHCVANDIGDPLGGSSNILYDADNPTLFYFNATGNCKFDSNAVRNVDCFNTDLSQNKMMRAICNSGNISCVQNYVLGINTTSSYSQTEANSNAGASLIGMEFEGTGTFNIHNNFVYNLTASNTTTLNPISVIGMQLDVKGKVHSNEIFRLRNQGIASLNLPYIIGMNVFGSNDTLYNNRIALTNKPHTNNINIFGIRKQSNATQLIAYHNTVYIGGSSSSGKSYDLYKHNNVNQTFDNTRNNIFYNERTGGGMNCALGNSNLNANNWGVCDYNNLYASNANTLCEWNGGNYLNFAQWKSTTSKDLNSKNSIVNFVNTLNDDYNIEENTNCAIDNLGTIGTGVTNDINSALRSTTTPDVGAEEFGYQLLVSATAQDSNVCAITQPVHLFATIGIVSSPSFLWTGPNGYTANIQEPINYAPTALNQGVYTVTLTDGNGCTASSTVNITVSTCPDVVLPLKIFIEGYYTGASTMTPALINQGVGISNIVVDTVIIELRNFTFPHILYATTQAVLNTDGSIEAHFPSNTSGNFYVVIKHRNAIETWSSSSVFLQETTSLYDFTTAANKAYGANQIEVESGVWALYSGDLNSDENIDLLDLSNLEADINTFQFGYFATDINGDGNVDLLDAATVENNVASFIFSIQP
ncbi:MAG TPA: dockerin type I domain-containing protein [Chitinophagaceae bacterium]|nr:dockerin type I domain-containing protein [Chitinophagaceae bacterium]